MSFTVVWNVAWQEGHSILEEAASSHVDDRKENGCSEPYDSMMHVLAPSFLRSLSNEDGRKIIQIDSIVTKTRLLNAIVCSNRYVSVSDLVASRTPKHEIITISLKEIDIKILNLFHILSLLSLSCVWYFLPEVNTKNPTVSNLTLSYYICIRVSLTSRDIASSALKMQVANYFETWVFLYQTTRRHAPEDSKLHIHRCDNLKSHTISWLGKHVSKCNIFTWIEFLVPGTIRDSPVKFFRLIPYRRFEHCTGGERRRKVTNSFFI
jgi:hypothetical protein